MSKAKLTRSLPTRYKELCLDLSAATDRWENEGGRTQLAQQEEVNLTLSSTTTIEPRSEQLVRRCFLRQANCSDTAYRWLDRAADRCHGSTFSLPHSWHKELPKVVGPLSQKVSKDHLDLLCYYYNVVRSLNLEGGILSNLSFFSVGEFSSSCSRTPNLRLGQ
jgi:hypothetical protein